MTFSTLASPGVSLQGGGGSGGGGGGTPGGSNTQIQYNSSGTFAGASGLTTNGTELTIASGTKTADAPVLNMSQTWNNGAITFTGLKFNVADTASAAASMLLNLQVGGTTQFAVRKDGRVYASLIGSDPAFGITPAAIFFSGSNAIHYIGGGEVFRAVGTALQINTANALSFSTDLFLTRRGAANLRLGAADAAAPVAQTLSVQSVVTGTSNTAGANLTITGSQGTGTGAGGSIIFQVAPAGGTGNTPNGLVNALTIGSDRSATFANYVLATVLYANSGTTHFTARSNYVTVASSIPFGFSATTNADALPDVVFNRDAANTLALRNGASAQTFNVYNTFTDASNYERGKIAWSSNVLQIGTEKAGTGTARALEFQTDGTTRLTISTAGNATVTGWIKSNTYFDAPAAALNGNGGIYFGVTATGAQIQATAVGVLAIANYAGSDFNRLQFGGTTSSFPALKRSSTTLQARLADDSAFASVQGKLTTDTAYAAGDPTTTGYLVVYDSTGTAYKIPAVAV